MYNPTGIMGNSVSAGSLGGGALAVESLPVTGVAINVLWLVLAALTLLSLGIMLTRLGRLATAESATDAGVFLR